MSTRLIEVDNTLEYLLDLIDKKIYNMSLSELDKLSFGIENKTNFDLFDDLEDYREIIQKKILGCNCLMEIPLYIISSRIKKLIKLC